MKKSQVFPYYRDCCKWFSEIYEIIKSYYTDTYVDELCTLRAYVGMEQRQLISNMELGCCNIIPDVLGEHARELGLLNKGQEFILNDRYIVPVYDIKNNLVALIGYYPDPKKYITTPSPFFSKNNLLFNYRQAYDLSWKYYGGFVIVVEGIFDCLSLRSLGLPVVSVMGVTLSKAQGELLKLFKKCIAIPDNDKMGRKALGKWNVPSNTTMIRVVGGDITIGNTPLKVKDMDDLVSWFDADDVREILLSFRSSINEVEDLVL